MFILANLLSAIATILSAIIWLAWVLILIRAVISWIPPGAHLYHPLYRALIAITEPMIRPVRKFVPYLGGIDFSPFVLVLILIFLDQFLVNSIHELAQNIKAGSYSQPDFGPQL